MPRKSTSSKSAVKHSPAVTMKETPTKPAAASTKAAPVIETAAAATIAATPTATTPATATIAAQPKAVEAKPGETKVEAQPAAAAGAAAPATASAAAPAAAEPSPAVNDAVWQLGSFDADTARDAASTLGRLGEASAVEPLIAALINADGFHHCVVRAAAAESLGLLRDRRAVEPLLDAVSDPIAEVSLEAIRALAVLGDARSTHALRQVVDDQTGFYVPMVRRAAEIALEQLAGR